MTSEQLQGMFEREELDEEMVEALRQLGADEVRRVLQPFLREAEVDGVLRRLDLLLAAS